jgi:hypothetical protein
LCCGQTTGFCGLQKSTSPSKSCMPAG